MYLPLDYTWLSSATIHIRICPLKVLKMFQIITHLAGQTYVWHSCKWNFAGPQIYLHPAKIKSQYFGDIVKIFGLKIESIAYEDSVSKFFTSSVFLSDTSVRNIQISNRVHTVKIIVSYNSSH